LQILFVSGFLYGEERLLEELFPGTSEAILAGARDGGYSRSMKTAEAQNAVSALTVKPPPETSMTRRLFDSNPMYIIESLLMVKSGKKIEKLDVYNALRRIRTLQGRKYFSSTRGKETVMFGDASIITGKNNFKKQNDPPYALSVPLSDTIFIMVDDVNFGHCYYRAEIKSSGPGILYSLSNFRSINYLLIPVIKPENLLIQLYLEPLDEGVVIYGLTGVNVAGFAENRVDVPSTISKRLDVIYGWIGDNIKTP
jgi:hypothetical protein